MQDAEQQLYRLLEEVEDVFADERSQKAPKAQGKEASFFRIPKNHQIVTPLSQQAQEWAEQGPFLLVRGRQIHPSTLLEDVDAAPAAHASLTQEHASCSDREATGLAVVGAAASIEHSEITEDEEVFLEHGTLDETICQHHGSDPSSVDIQGCGMSREDAKALQAGLPCVDAESAQRQQAAESVVLAAWQDACKSFAPILRAHLEQQRDKDAAAAVVSDLARDSSLLTAPEIRVRDPSTQIAERDRGSAAAAVRNTHSRELSAAAPLTHAEAPSLGSSVHRTRSAGEGAARAQPNTPARDMTPPVPVYFKTPGEAIRRKAVSSGGRPQWERWLGLKERFGNATSFQDRVTSTMRPGAREEAEESLSMGPELRSMGSATTSASTLLSALPFSTDSSLPPISVVRPGGQHSTGAHSEAPEAGSDPDVFRHHYSTVEQGNIGQGLDGHDDAARLGRSESHGAAYSERLPSLRKAGRNSDRLALPLPGSKPGSREAPTWKP